MTRAVLAGVSLLAAAPLAAGAQSREIQRHDVEDPEGRLMAFYAAALAVSAIGPRATEPPWSIRAGLELSHIPHLSRAQRTAGFDKPESSNLSPILPRPRLSLSAPRGLHIEAAWLPPIEVFDARANLYSLALSWAMPGARRLVFTPRIVAAGGRATGAITCNDALRRGTPSEQVYFANVCYSRQSDDHFDPRQLAVELTTSRATGRRFVPFATLGVRHDDARFDIGVRLPNGSRDPDHPILEMRTTRPYVSAGSAWRWGRTDAAAELYYAPGSLITARVRADVLLRRARVARRAG